MKETQIWGDKDTARGRYQGSEAGHLPLGGTPEVRGPFVDGDESGAVGGVREWILG